MANKTELLDYMIDLVFSEIELPARGADWQASMRLRAISVRRVLSRRRWAIGLMETRTSPGPATLHHHEAVLACLRDAGFTIEMAAHASAVLDSYIYGFALQEAGLPFRTSEETDDISRALLDQMPPDEFPRLTELTLEHIFQPTYDPDDEYEFGLDLILNGLEPFREAPQCHFGGGGKRADGSEPAAGHRTPSIQCRHDRGHRGVVLSLAGLGGLQHRPQQITPVFGSCARANAA